MSRYPVQYKETEKVILSALEAVEDAISAARVGRAEHVQALDRSRETLEAALEHLRDARPNEVW
ncbi:MAG: hypothetical protein R3195_07435 [Gemmatimonadota bacterium]|nr:hypothetical protein [Gemmatimonadota bacterium]